MKIDVYRISVALDRAIHNAIDTGMHVKMIEMDFATYHQFLIRKWSEACLRKGRLHYRGLPCYIVKASHPFTSVRGAYG